MTNLGFISENMNYCTKIGSFQLMCLVAHPSQLVEWDCLRAQKLSAMCTPWFRGCCPCCSWWLDFSSQHHSTPAFSTCFPSLYIVNVKNAVSPWRTYVFAGVLRKWRGIPVCLPAVSWRTRPNKPSAERWSKRRWGEPSSWSCRGTPQGWDRFLDRAVQCSINVC